MPAGVVVSGGKALSDQPTYSYDSPSAATTLPVNLRTVTLAAMPAPRAAPRAAPAVA